MRAINIFKSAAHVFLKSDYDGKGKLVTIRQLQKAWRKSEIDGEGAIWVNADCLNVILRTTKINARIITDQLGADSDAVAYIDKKKYIYGPKVLEIIADQSLENSSDTKEIYLEISQDMYRQIWFSSDAKQQRADNRNSIGKALKGLKDKRQKLYSITHDELTGEPLRGDSEFSHIKSKHIYRAYQLSVENGLIVNKETHRIITANDVKDENDLKELCEKMGWKLDWYDEYSRWIQSFDADSGE